MLRLDPDRTTKTSITIPITISIVAPVARTEVAPPQDPVAEPKPCLPAPPTGCGNQGLAYVLQAHTYTNRPAPAFQTFVVDHFKTAKPIQQGILSGGLGFVNRASQAPISIYGGPSRDKTDFVALNHRGYFVPKASGTYTIICDNHDDLLLLWVGATGFDAAYTRENANLELQYNGAGTTGHHTVAMTAGCHVPFRLLVANAQGAAWRGFACTIKDPAGTVVVDLSTGCGDNFVQFSSDGTVGAFKPLGRELP